MIPFAPWLPDVAEFNTAASTDALNVIPSQTGFRPFPGFQNVTSAVTARAQGAASFRSISGTIYNFCGDATKLYLMDSDGLGWSDISRLAGGAYGTATDGQWRFSQYGNYVIALNGNNAAQVFELGVSTNFAALGGSSPAGTFPGTIREFGVIAKTSTANNRITWSAIGDISDWVASATTLADSQDFPEGGTIMGFVGGEYGVVFQERAIQRMTFAGPPTAFRFDKITTALGCRVEGSIAAYESLIFFLADDGFYMLRGGAELVPIGTEKVDRWLEETMDGSQLYRATSAIDPINKVYIMGFPSVGAGNPDSFIIYHWPSGQWSRASVNHEIIYTAATQSSYTIDGMDTVSSTIDALPFPVDSRFWTGSGRLLLSGFDTSHRQGFFSGSNLAATVETGDNQAAEGRRSLFRGLRPIIEGTSVTPSLTVGSRDHLTESVTYGSPAAVNSYGWCNARVQARYHRAKITIPAASSWNFARGVDDLKISLMGRR